MLEITLGCQLIAEYLNALATKGPGNLLFRGHANKGWAVVPSAFRQGVVGIKSDFELDRWKEAAARFVERPQSDLEWLVLAQHYGVSTPVLDWSSNPLVALYFACQPAADLLGNPVSGNVVAIPRDALRRERSPSRVNVFERWEGAPLLVPSGPMNKRSLAQDSVMTLHCDENKSLLPDYNPEVFGIEVSRKSSALAALRVVGVSSDRIFADINTAAREFVDELAQTAAIRALGTRS